MIINFLGCDCEVEFTNYVNGQNAIVLWDAEDGSPFANASVAIDDFVDEDEVAIKNYSENEGILDILISSGIVSDPIRFVRSGFVEIPICKLLYRGE